jgi:nicotinate phosphoribosyltransferase
MQVFQKKDAVLCGIDEALAVLRLGTGYYNDRGRAFKLFDKLIELKKHERETYYTDYKAYLAVVKEKLDVSQQLDDLWEDRFFAVDIEALFDGDRVSPWETVMHIRGDASLFAHLETVYLGVLARRTKIATNVRRVVEAAGKKTIMFFPARFDHWGVQGGDGYAAHIGGATAVSTPAQAKWWGAKSSGTIPHALIAAVGGDTVAATKIFHESYPNARLIALVDFDNDSVNTALKCAREFGERLWGVRLDTAENMVDKAIIEEMGELGPAGVNPRLVELTRNALDRDGFHYVKIVVTGGFNSEKIAAFEKLNVPDDAVVISKAVDKNEEAYSGFEGTDLADRLKGLGVEEVIVVGLTTDYCVRTTTLDANREGFKTIVVPEAARAVNVNPDDGTKSIEEMKSNGATLRSVDEILMS